MQEISEILVITGATASGKTKLAIQMARANNAEIICADSRSVYRDLDIVSAKVMPDEMEGIQHHMLDILSPDEDFSAGEFKNRALEIIADIQSREKNVIVAGGTWFYISSLLGLVDIPEVEPNYELRESLSKKSSLVLYDMLLDLNEKRAREIAPENRERVIRAIEIALAGEVKSSKSQKIPYKMIAPDISRENLYERINKRVDLMIEMGLEAEYRRNVEKYGNLELFDATIGYQEFIKLDKGIYPNKEFAIDKIKQHTRNFAKRQITWFKSRSDIEYVKC